MNKPKNGLLFVVSAPSGTGKTTLMEMVLKEFPHVVRSVTSTTRPPRKSEKEGQDYFFLTEEEFNQKVAKGEFLEYARLFGFSYGTSHAAIENERAKGNHVILVIDTQGAMEIKKKTDAIFIFISPPSLEELKKRLVQRKSETLQDIEKRIDWARHELEMISHYDYHIVNDELQAAYRALKSIIIAEEHRLR